MRNNTSFEKTLFCIHSVGQNSPIFAYPITPSRARITGILHFLLSQVSHYPPSPLTFRTLRIYQKTSFVFHPLLHNQKE